MINRILDEFDFERVHRAMESLNWKWFDCDGVPRVADLRRCARRLLTDVSRSGRYVATGGFVARRHECGGLSLAFEIDSVYDLKGD